MARVKEPGALRERRRITRAYRQCPKGLPVDMQECIASLFPGVA